MISEKSAREAGSVSSSFVCGQRIGDVLEGWFQWLVLLTMITFLGKPDPVCEPASFRAGDSYRITHAFR